MATVSQFLDTLRRSGLVESTKLDVALVEIENDATEAQIDDVDYVTAQLVKRYLLTAWQVRQLLKGRYKGYLLRQYKILGHLGAGGMSTVFLAEHTLMQRRVAIKVLPRKRLEKSIYLERFIREAQAIATLDHPNIIRAYDIDQEGDIHYIVMEYFDGENLQRIVDKEGKILFSRIANILRQAADALSYAHDVGVIHRDIKPSNILVNKEGTVKVLDLGLALLDEKMFEGRITHIQEDTILGTADYLAPEQALDSHKVDARADIYGLGGVLYFCLTGHPPFPEGSVSRRLLAHQQTEPPSVLIDRPDTPEDMVLLCKKMMSKNPDDRQQSCAEVARDFEDWLIAHGYAESTDFIVPTLQRVQHYTRDLSKSAIQRAVGRGKLLQLLHQMDVKDAQKSNAGVAASESDFSILGGEVSVNLLDSTVGPGLSAPDGKVKSKASLLSAAGDDIEDPIMHALHDIERLRSKKRLIEEPAKKLRRESAASQRVSEPSPREPAQPIPILHSPQQQVWFRQVPVWFWTLFISGYAAAIFLAGILTMLLIIYFGSNRI